MDVRLDFDDNAARLSAELISENAGDFAKPLMAWHAHMVGKIDRQFKMSGDGILGGTWRGVRWKPFAPFSREGVLLPAHGGVTPSGRKVLGRKRPSGQRITMLSQLMQDTGRMRQRAAIGIIRIYQNTLEFGPGLRYASAQHGMRPFLFVTDEEQQTLVTLVAKHLMGE